MRYRAISPRETLDIGGYKIQATKVNHASVPAYGYILENSNGDAVVYTGDTGPTDRIWRRMKGRRVKCLIIEVSFPDEMADLALTSGHLTPALLLKEIEKMPAIPDRIYITHLKPAYREAIEEQLARLGAIRVEILTDGACLYI
jgi:ribonuclease BN (tRNA processing enzyme)